MKVRICQIFTIENGDDGWTEIHDNDGLVITRKPTLELAFNDIVEMVTNESLTDDIEADITDVVGGSATQEELDELVHDTKAAEATNINNAGREAQVAYLTKSRGGSA